MTRWWRFNAIGVLGAGLQLLVLGLLRLGVHYLVAAALAVELAILHNYFWHLKWTWPDRGKLSRRRAFVLFHVAKGTVSLVSNVVMMRVLAGQWHVAPLPANGIAIASTSVVNYLLGDRWVFRGVPRALPVAKSPR